MKKVNVLWLKVKTTVQAKFEKVMQSEGAAFFVGLALMFLLVVAIIALFAIGFAFIFLVPGLLLGTAFWFGWTAMGLGQMFFPDLSAQWQTIGYWPTVFFTSVLVFAIKLIRPKKAKESAIQSDNYEPGQRGYRLRK